MKRLSAFVLMSLCFAGDAYSEVARLPGAPVAQPTTEAIVPPLSRNCRTQNVQPRQFPAGDYEIRNVESPYSESYQLTVAVGSFQYYVDMPTSAKEPYRLGSKGDFEGVATICRLLDPATKQEYEQITLNSQWNPNSGGAYNLQFSFLPFTPGFGIGAERITSQTVYLVDGDVVDKGKDPNACLVTSSEEEDPPARDLVLSPELYYHDHVIANMRGWLKPWSLVDSVDDILKAVGKAAEGKGSAIHLVLASHGSTDLWAMNKDDALNLKGENESVRALGRGAKGKVAQLDFYSCCTGKLQAAGIAPNVLDTLAEELSDGGKHRVSVCGYEHQFFLWFRNGAFHAGRSKGDTRPCASR